MMFSRSAWAWFFLWALTLASASPVPTLRGMRAVDTTGGVEGDEPRGVVLLSELSPEEVFGPELETRGGRDKRKLSWILDIIFWKFNKILELKTRILSGFNTRPRNRPASSSANLKGVTTTTAEPLVEFEGNRVSLVLPDELFGSAFTVVTDVSKIIGSVIMNSARRTQTFFEALKPIFRSAFGIRRSTSAVLGDRLPPALLIPSSPPPPSPASPTAGEEVPVEDTEVVSTTAEGTEDSPNDT